MELACIFVIIVAAYLRKRLKLSVTAPQWNRLLLGALFIAIALLLLQSTDVHVLDIIANWLGFVLLCGLMYLISSNEKFKSARFLIVAIMPFMAVVAAIEIIRLINKDFARQWDTLLGTLTVFAFIWGIGVWIVTGKQRKALQTAQQKALDEEQKNKVIASMKDELEIQVAERTAELTKQKEELESTLKELQATQAQLIQSEKMASLGELTAGIAHEIQNPLNFVSNFSDVNNELLEEMLLGIQSNNVEEVKSIAGDIKDNNAKIIFHGKRADAIVKGMLQHSRKNTGQKEATDINALCDEYLRLSYHGLRAKDKSFNADFKTSFDGAIGKIEVIPQDLGRVLLNLFNNAFYAVNNKSKDTGGLESYKPTVTVSTQRIFADGNKKVEIRVIDNGNGIPKSVIDKIFQPFFTTKPTGQGTGLGLSLSYEIIEAHNGEIKAESKEGEGTTFIIELPA